MDALTFLKQVRAERLECESIEQHKEELRMSLIPSGIRCDKERVQTSPEDRMPAVMAKLSEIEEEEENHLIRLRNDIKTAIRLIDSMQTAEHRQLLRLRYIEGGRRPKTWYDIGEEMGYSSDYVRGKLHGCAIAEARRVWKENTLGHTAE